MHGHFFFAMFAKQGSMFKRQNISLKPLCEKKTHNQIKYTTFINLTKKKIESNKCNRHRILFPIFFAANFPCKSNEVWHALSHLHTPRPKRVRLFSYPPDVFLFMCVYGFLEFVKCMLYFRYMILFFHLIFIFSPFSLLFTVTYLLNLRDCAEFNAAENNRKL